MQLHFGDLCRPTYLYLLVLGCWLVHSVGTWYLGMVGAPGDTFSVSVNISLCDQGEMGYVDDNVKFTHLYVCPSHIPSLFTVPYPTIRILDLCNAAPP